MRAAITDKLLMSALLGSSILLFCILACASTQQLASESIVKLPECGPFTHAQPLSKSDRETIFTEVVVRKKHQMKYVCFRENQAYLYITNQKVFKALGGYRNTEIKVYQEYAGQVVFSEFAKQAAEYWKLGEMSHYKEFGCNYKSVPWPDPKGYSRSMHEIVCVFA